MTPSKNCTIALLGTGIMGVPMAHRIMLAGYTLRIWNRTRGKTQSLVEEGAIWKNSPSEAVDGADIIMTMFTDGPVTNDILFKEDEGGACPAKAAKDRALFIVMSSIGATEARDQAQKLAGFGCRYIDAPVSGGEKGAIAGTLSIMAGGAKTDIAFAKPVFETMGTLVHVGPIAAGQITKIANQMIVGISISAVAEALILLEIAGVDLDAAHEALSAGFADSVVLRQIGRRIIEKDFNPGGRTYTQLKDLNNAAKLMAETSLSLPTLSLVRSLYEDACNKHGDLDHSALYLALKNRYIS